MDAATAEKPKHSAPTRRGARGGRPGRPGRRPYFEKKKSQRRLEIDAVGEAYKSFQIEPELYQILVPLSPDFLYDIAVLDLDLRISRHYPHQGDPTSILVNNKEIARGHAANVERAFLKYDGTLLERVQHLVADLENLLALPPARTVTIVRGRAGAASNGSAPEKPRPTSDATSAPIAVADTITGNRSQPSTQAEADAKTPTEQQASSQPKTGRKVQFSGSAPDNSPDDAALLLDSLEITEPRRAADSDSDSDSGSDSESDSALGPAPGSRDEGSSDSDSDSDTEYLHESDDDDIDVGGSSQDVSRPKREGTEIVFQDISLVNIAVCEIVSLNLLFQCGRCKTPHTFQNIQSGDYGRASKPKAELCGKCDLPLTVAFRKDYLHSMSHTAGYLDVDGGRPIDLLPSSYGALCGQCQSPTPVFKNVDFGALRLQSCRHCHAKMSLRIELASFSLLSTESLDAAAKRAQRGKLPASAPKQQLNLKGGEPLPNEGRCAHYRRSQRWFRFSCCQRVFPCDRCHDTEMHHPAEQANRMVCGFCSREQRFNQKCKACDHDFTLRHTRFWEGGKGARDQTQMSRKDSRKFKRAPGQKSQKQASHFQGKSKTAAK